MKDMLPPAARTKLLALQGQANDATDAALSAQRRIEDLKRGLSYSEEPPPDAGSIEHEIARLQAVRQVQSNRQRALASLCANIGNWMLAQPRTAEFEVASASAAPQEGETVSEAIARVRHRIEETKATLRRTENAPMPNSDIKALVPRYVAELAERARPKITAGGGSLAVAFGEAKGFAFSRHDVTALLAWRDPAGMIASLEAEIDALPEPDFVLPATEKAKRLEEGQRALLQLERSEEALIGRASVEGIDVLRRANADPRAVLGIRSKRRAAAKAA
jgi:hypothetical protein